MDRVTAKTMDAYVEFLDVEEAVHAMNRFTRNKDQGHAGRIGNRHIDMEMVGHNTFMKELFPKAKNVFWNGSQPQIMPAGPNNMHDSGFKGFVSSEELFSMVRHVEAPERVSLPASISIVRSLLTAHLKSPFAKDCPQRPYECLITTLRKVRFQLKFTTILLTNSSIQVPLAHGEPHQS